MFNFLQINNNSEYKSLKETKSLIRILREINSLEEWARNLSPEDFPKQTLILKKKYSTEHNLDLLIPEAFALCREAARRTLGERMFDVQLLGGIILHQGRIAEMKTGEGKTLTSTSAAYLNTISNNSVHIVTVNDYLAQRDSEWMQPVFEYLGQTVGYIISDMPGDLRREMYTKNIVYATNNELGFDYLRDNLRLEKNGVCSSGYHYCIVDEIDSVLIDEARTPLIISGQATDDTEKYKQANSIISYLEECSKDPNTDKYPEDNNMLDGDFKTDEKSKTISFTHEGTNKIERLLNKRNIIEGSIEEMKNFEFIHYVTQTLRAHKLFYVNVDYMISDERKVEIIDEFTGRVLKGRRYSDGLHQAIEAKEGIKIERQNRTLASVTFQNFFRMYTKLSGMTGTAVTEEKEFIKIYGLDVVELPTNKPVIRDDQNDLIYVNEATKIKAILKEIIEVNEKGQPILLGTASIESSEKLSTLLKRNKINHNILNAKQHKNEAGIIAEAGIKGAVTIATNMAGRGTDIKLGGNLDVRIQSRITEEHSEEDITKIREQEISRWQSDYKEVQELGGLYVLGTERHESRRIDNQLRGRSGRQGDPGLSQFFLSLDDQLLRLFGQGIDRMRSLMSRALNEDEPLSHSLISKTMERAQKNVETRNFEIRKHLLNFDEVLNNQKNTIYTQRENILCSDNLLDRLENNLEDILTQHAKKIAPETEEETSQQIILFVQDSLQFQQEILSSQSYQEIITSIKEDLKNKSNLIGKTLFNDIVRIEYLKLIDHKWQDHITQLEELRQAVYLRSYAQKNPLLEYKLESYEMFDSIVEDIAIGILRKFIGLKAENIHIRHENNQNKTLYTKHQDFSLFNNTSPHNTNNTASKHSNTYASPNKGNMHTASNQIMRSTSKIGRNDLCPCGSGKKYKRCHGLEQ